MKRAPEAWQDEKIFDRGIGQVVIARFKANGDAEIGVFLLDVHALGVKNAFFKKLFAGEYEATLERIFVESQPVAMAPAAARKLVESAVTYARNLGLDPHPDYRLGQRVFGGIDPKECAEDFTFGKDGQPLYVQGPNDSPEFVARVMAALKRHCGPDKFHYILALDSMDSTEEDEGCAGN
jgi:hypothetical protein